MADGQEQRQERLTTPTDLERKLLVFYKKFSSLESMPNRVSAQSVEMVRNKARVHLNLAMVGVFSGVFLYTCWSGKQAARRGVSVERMNREFHAEYNDPANVDGKMPEIRRDW